MKVELICNLESERMRLDKFLSTNITSYSRTRLKDLIIMGKVKLNGKLCHNPNTALKFNDIIEAHLPPLKIESFEEYDFPLNIIYEDEYLLIIDKPAGLMVHPGVGNTNKTLVNCLIKHYPNGLSTAAGPMRPGIVHRLDKDTSGLLIIAKNNATHTKLSSMLKAKEIKRTYLALVYGSLDCSIGTISTGYGKNKRNPTKMEVKRVSDRQAITHYKQIKSNKFLALLECILETGRTHQIRVHLDWIGHPIVGDKVYGKNKNFNLQEFPFKVQIKDFPRQALHAYKLEFTHPHSNQPIVCVSPLPQDINSLIEMTLYS